MKTRLYIAASAFTLSYGAAAFVARQNLGLGWGIAATVAAVLAFGWFIVEEVSVLRNCLDELQRRIQLEAIALGFSFFTLFLIGLGCLQRFVILSPADWSYRHIWPFAALFYVIGIVITKARYR
ncbi:MAG: hypothetical protein ABIR71_12285 [Chthoniobacterales bacterium]